MSTSRRVGPVAWLLIWPIRFYQVAISRFTPPSCRYYPCCSSYAIGALRRHGAAKGLALGAWRLLRCNPWSSGGVDKVPERGRWRPVPDDARAQGEKIYDASPPRPGPGRQWDGVAAQGSAINSTVVEKAIGNDTVINNSAIRSRSRRGGAVESATPAAGGARNAGRTAA